MNLVIAGASGLEHIGRHLSSAADQLGISHRFVDVSDAYRGSFVTRKVQWHLCGRRPARLLPFSNKVLNACRSDARYLITIGLAPLTSRCINKLSRSGIITINFLTDDPWNPAHSAKWFLEALPKYDIVFTPRIANIQDLRAVGCKRVEYLPFGYAADLHVPAARSAGSCDVFFAGGADQDRIEWISSLAEAGIDVGLYGGYWNRFSNTRRLARGFVHPAQLNRYVAGARLCLCLTRKANRDGHSMRSFELAAMKACMVVERTDEHLSLFGHNRECVVYFSDRQELLNVVRGLLSDENERIRLSHAAYRLITKNKHTYSDRLRQMLARTNIGITESKDIVAV